MSSTTLATATEDETRLEGAYYVAQELYLAWAPHAPPAAKASVKALFGEVLTCTGTSPNFSCKGILQLARTAMAAGDAPTLSAEVAQASYLLCQANATIGGKDPAVCKAPS